MLRLIDDGRPTLLFGEAGVGKTALVRVAARASGRRLVETGALSTLSWMPHLPFRRLLGRRPEGDAVRIAASVEHSVGDALLLVDDLQWADPGSLEVVALLASRVELVVTVRRGDPGASLAVEELAAAQFELFPVEPLTPTDAVLLVTSLRPELARASVDALVARAGGNPLLLRELAHSGEPTESLLLSVAARLRLLEPDARTAMGLLALAGRPLSHAILGAGAENLVETGLAEPRGSGIALRHALVGEAAVELFEQSEREALHARLARRIRDPGEAARHHAAAGERAEAYSKALRAVSRAVQPGERAAHLVVAAVNSSGPEAERLRIEAAEAAVAAGHYRDAVALVNGTSFEDDERRARSDLVQARASMAERDLREAARHLADAAVHAGLVGGLVEVEIMVARVRLGVELREQPDDLVSQARTAVDLAHERGGLAASALHAQALALQPVDYTAYIEKLREALGAARAEDAVELECIVADTLCRPSIAGSDEVAREMVERASELKLAAWERRFRCRLAGIDFHRGRFARAYEAGESLLLVALEPWERYLLAYYTAQAASDLGLHERAATLLDELDGLAAAGHESRRQALWGRADAELLAGRPARALAVADALLAEFPEAGSTFVHVTRAWALVEVGEAPVVEASVEPDSAFLAGAEPELRAVALLAAGAHNEAAEGFAIAAGRWAGQHTRGQLRCMWGFGEALRRAGDTEAAVERLLEAERRALEVGHVPYLARIHRSLRLAGVRRAAPRVSASRGLTGREQEILTFVARGLSNAEIARRLGIARPTIDRLIASASSKLGASSRLQAAALATALE